MPITDPSGLSDTLQLAFELIRRPSVTPDDQGCQPLLIKRLQALGFEVETLWVEGVANFWARRGRQGPILTFAGHTDVVPSGPLDAWTQPPFVPCIDDEGMLRGRGASDMKGSLAAMLTAVERFVGRHPDHDGQIGFLITADEEGPAIHGTRAVVDILAKRGIHLDYCIVGEPSSDRLPGDTIRNGRRGSLGGVLRIDGVQGHVAYPHLAINPIHQALPALQALTKEHWDSGNAHFPATSFQISNLNAGTGATNVIPAQAEAVFNFRFSSEIQPDEIKARTHALLDAHGLDYRLDWTLSGSPFLTESGALMDAARTSVKAVTGTHCQFSTSGGTSDGRFIATLGAQVIELGPCNATIHQIDERVRAEDLDTLSCIHESILDTLLLHTPA